MLTAKTRLAMQVITIVAQNHPKTVSISKIIKLTGSSREFTYQACKDLKQAGLLKAFRGKQGGYAFGSSIITLREVVEATKDPVTCTHTEYKKEIEPVLDWLQDSVTTLFEDHVIRPGGYWGALEVTENAGS